MNSKLKPAVTLLIIFLTFSPFLMFSVYADPGPAAFVKVSLPEGTCVGFDPDPWLSECWLLNLTGSSQTFTVRVNNTSAAKRSYDTHLIIALNGAGYNNLENLIVNGTSVPKSAFQHGTPTPYNLGWTWPSGDVYPTWFNDTLVNIGTIERKEFKDVVVSVTFSNATDVRMHFDAYGCTVYPPTKKGHIIHNGISEDSTVLFQPGPPAPQPPYAHFFYDPSYPNSNEMVTFNASESYDPDGYIVSYSWDFGDETPIVIESDPITNHTYTTFGNYTVTLTVTDNDNLTANATATIHVSQHPVAAFSFSPIDPLEHEVVTFDASASTPDGGTLISYEWNFGDGNITTRPDPIITHAYSEFGNYTVTLNITDSEGKWDIESKLVTVEALPIADFWWSPFYPQRCENVTFDASSSTPDGGVIVSYAWDFGDGTPIVIESSPITTHNYTAIGNYTVTLNVTDSEGRWDTESEIITVVARRYLVTFTQTGLDATADGAIVTINGSAKTFADLPFSMWVDENTQIIYTYESIVTSTTSGKRFVLIDVTGPASPITITESVTFVGNYKTQYYLTVISPHGSPTPTSGWFNAGTEITASVTSPWSGPAGVQYVCTGWTGTGSVPASGTTTSVSFTINEPSSITWNWKIQYYLTVNTNPAEVFTLNPAAVSGEGWYDSGFTATVDAVQNVDKVAGQSRYDFRSWTGATSTGLGNQATVLMDGPKTATANYQLQYYITFNQIGVGLDFTGTVVTIDGIGYSTLPVSSWWDKDSIHTFAFQSPLVVTANAKQYVWTSTTGLSTLQSGSITILASGNITGNYKTQYYLTVSSPCDSPTPTSGWFDAGTSITASVTSPWSGPAGVQYVCTGWTGTGNVPASGTTTSVIFTINEPSSIIWNWKTQYYLTVQTDPTGLSPAPTPSSGWYDEGTDVVLTAPDTSYLNSDEYSFEYWDVDGTSQGTGVNPITVTMNQLRTATAYYTLVTPPPPPPSVTISPLSATINLGDSVVFTSTVTGGTAPYSYQWYLGGVQVSGATSDTWTFTPTATGIYYVYLQVKDANNNIAQSETARIIVSAVPVGGYSVSLTKPVAKIPLICYTMLLAIFGVVISLIRHKRK